MCRLIWVDNFVRRNGTHVGWGDADAAAAKPFVQPNRRRLGTSLAQRAPGAPPATAQSCPTRGSPLGPPRGGHRGDAAPHGPCDGGVQARNSALARAITRSAQMPDVAGDTSRPTRPARARRSKKAAQSALHSQSAAIAKASDAKLQSMWCCRCGAPKTLRETASVRIRRCLTFAQRAKPQNSKLTIHRPALLIS